jgi:hypothetical protein
MAAVGEGARVPLVVTAADVVEDRGPLAEVPAGQLALDAPLPCQQPVHGGVDLLVVGVGDAQFVGQGGVVPAARGGEFGARGEDALGDEGQHQGALAARLGGQQGVEADLGQGGQDGLDVSVRLGGDDTEGLLGSHQGFPAEGLLDELDDVRG